MCVCVCVCVRARGCGWVGGCVREFINKCSKQVFNNIAFRYLYYFEEFLFAQVCVYGTCYHKFKTFKVIGHSRQWKCPVNLALFARPFALSQANIVELAYQFFSDFLREVR